VVELGGDGGLGGLPIPPIDYAQIGEASQKVMQCVLSFSSRRIFVCMFACIYVRMYIVYIPLYMNICVYVCMHVDDKLY
jgi:hypothetical protein